MDDALLVRRLEGGGDLRRHFSASVIGTGPRRTRLFEGDAFHEFEHQESRAVVILEAMDDGDVGMAQRREQFRLAFQPREAVGILAPASRAAS